LFENSADHVLPSSSAQRASACEGGQSHLRGDHASRGARIGKVPFPANESRPREFRPTLMVLLTAQLRIGPRQQLPATWALANLGGAASPNPRTLGGWDKTKQGPFDQELPAPFAGLRRCNSRTRRCLCACADDGRSGQNGQKDIPFKEDSPVFVEPKLGHSPS
jgi:hypothetical protein